MKTREIKFRGYSLKYKKWIYGSLVNDRGRFYIFNQIRDGRFLDAFNEVEKESVGEFTGLLDKNGKDIYDGDLLKNGGNNPPSEVKFKNGMFVMGVYGLTTLYVYSGDTKEIIGNIYKNPNLLTQ